MLVLLLLLADLPELCTCLCVHRISLTSMPVVSSLHMRHTQVGAGGGMKGGVNMWTAQKDCHYLHPSWIHCAGRPYR
jgi:hypothetical protein